MYSLNELVTLFLPNSTAQEQQDFLVVCENKAIDYDSRSWLLVQDFELSSEKIKANLVRTVYQVQENYDGVVNEILNSLEIWSDNTLVFSDLNDDDQLFLERVYVFLAITHFTFLPTSRQIFVLGSRFLTLAAVWNIPLISKVQNHFTRFCNLDVLTQDATLFAKAIENNPTNLTETESVSSIVKKYIQAGAGIDPTDYLEKLKEAGTFDETLAEVFWTILTLYHKLESGDIWKKVTYSTCSHAKADQKETFDPAAYYLHRLEESSDLDQWITDYKAIAEWAKDRDLAWVKKMLKIVKIKISADNGYENILNLTTSLAEQGHPEVTDFFFFDETAGKFTWNSEI